MSFWLPGFFGSLAATPLQPGFSLTSIYCHTSVEAGAEVARAREIRIGGFQPLRRRERQLDRMWTLPWSFLPHVATPVRVVRPRSA